MSKVEALRALVSERLAAAAEDIFVLFERTMVEYEEEMSRSKEEIRRKPQLLDSALSPRMELVEGNVNVPSTSPDPGLDQDLTETPWIKEEPEEHNVRFEAEQLLVPEPESTAVCLKAEESSQQAEGLSSEPYSRSATEGHIQLSDTDKVEIWGPPLSFLASQMETEMDGDRCDPAQNREQSRKLFPQNQSGLETSVHSGLVSEAEWKRSLCLVGNKTFCLEKNLKTHIRLHTDGIPYSCSYCKKHFADSSTLRRHQRIHTGERPYSCPFCERTFNQKSSLDSHVRIHTGERPYSCLMCKKHFADSSALRRHERTHTGERPYSCPVCEKTFGRKEHLQTHMKTHPLALPPPATCSNV